jgi:hypothetical protein
MRDNFSCADFFSRPRHCDRFTVGDRFVICRRRPSCSVPDLPPGIPKNAERQKGPLREFCLPDHGEFGGSFSLLILEYAAAPMCSAMNSHHWCPAVDF